MGKFLFIFGKATDHIAGSQISRSVRLEIDQYAAQRLFPFFFFSIRFRSSLFREYFTFPSCAILLLSKVSIEVTDIRISGVIFLFVDDAA